MLKEHSRTLADPRATHYEVLSVSPGDDEETLREARRTLMLMVHPDRNLAGTAHDFSARVNAAYSALSNEASRKRYDASLRTTHSLCGPCEGVGFRLLQRGFKKTTKVHCLGCGGTGWTRKGA